MSRAVPPVRGTTNDLWDGVGKLGMGLGCAKLGMVGVWKTGNGWDVQNWEWLGCGKQGIVGMWKMGNCGGRWKIGNGAGVAWGECPCCQGDGILKMQLIITPVLCLGPNRPQKGEEIWLKVLLEGRC